MGLWFFCLSRLLLDLMLLVGEERDGEGKGRALEQVDAAGGLRRHGRPHRGRARRQPGAGGRSRGDLRDGGRAPGVLVVIPQGCGRGRGVDLGERSALGGRRRRIDGEQERSTKPKGKPK